MIVVAIIGILAAIALPNMTEYSKKARRSAAQSVLLNIASQEVQRLRIMRGFVAVDIGTAKEVNVADIRNLLLVAVPDEVATDYAFGVDITNGFLATAAPRASGVMSGDISYTISHTGERGPAGRW
jgi:type IV pilus assembly protein PilE